MPSLMLHASMKAIKKSSSSNSLGSFLSFIMGFESHLKRPWCCGRRILCALLTHFSFSSSILFFSQFIQKLLRTSFIEKSRWKNSFNSIIQIGSDQIQERAEKRRKKYFLSQCLILAIDCVKSHFCPSRHSSLKS